MSELSAIFPESGPAFARADETIQKAIKPAATVGLENYIFGKVQPQAIQAEEAVLGALMLDRDAVNMVCDLLRPECFYLDAHQLIYKAILRLNERQNPVDLLTVTEQLRNTAGLDKIGGGYYLVELTNRIASAANIEYHARIIFQKWMQRELIKHSTNCIKSAYEDIEDVFALVDDHQANVFNIISGVSTSTASSALDAVILLMNQVERACQVRATGGLLGITTGIVRLDKEAGGWQNSDLIIIAARPGMGKTAYACNTEVTEACRAGKKVGLFSLEMTKTQLIGRIMAGVAGIDSQKLKTGDMTDADWQALQGAGEEIGNWSLWIDDTPGITAQALRSRARRMKMTHGLDLVIVDYLQLMEGLPGLNREQQVGTIGRALKLLAKELDIPVIALSQLSRAVETRGGSKRPQLSDMRDSGQLEEHADVVAFIYRPEYYQILYDETGRDLTGVTEFIIAKHRSGSLETYLLNFEKQYARFTEASALPFSPRQVSGGAGYHSPDEPRVVENW